MTAAIIILSVLCFLLLCSTLFFYGLWRFEQEVNRIIDEEMEDGDTEDILEPIDIPTWEDDYGENC